MKIVKLVVGKGLSLENEDGIWTKVKYEMTAELEFQGEESAAKEAMERTLDGWLKGIPIAPIKTKPPTPAPLPGSATKWRDTKNPDIEWCPEKEAYPEDVKKALAKEDGMWTMRDERQGLSIFRKKPKEGTA